MKRIIAILLMGIVMLAAGCAREEMPDISHDGGFIPEAQPPQAEVEDQREESNTNVSGNTARLTNEQLLKYPQIILRGVPVAKAREWMLNPDGTRTDEQGNLVVNEQITEYTIKISEMYRGAWDQDHINVKISNGYGQTPDMILNGEDKDANLTASGGVIRYLPLDKEAVFFLSWSDSGLEEEHGYYISCFPLGYLTLNADGTCSNNDANSYALKDLK